MLIIETEEYKKWFSKQRDTILKATILRRLERIRDENYLSDVKAVGENVFEL